MYRVEWDHQETKETLEKSEPREELVFPEIRLVGWFTLIDRLAVIVITLMFINSLFLLQGEKGTKGDTGETGDIGDEGEKVCNLSAYHL